jgi:hypothetical protein
MTGFDVYLIFHALKSHFARDYDYFKYGGALLNFNAESYREISFREQALYDKIAKKYADRTELEHFLVANILVTQNKLVVADLNRMDAFRNYNDWLKRTQALQYTFTSDLRHIVTASKQSGPKLFNSLFKPGEHEHPPILRLLLRSTISIETFLILDNFLDFFVAFDKKLPGDLVWERVRFRCDKYRQFVKRLIANTDSEIFEQAIRNTFAATAP